MRRSPHRAARSGGIGDASRSESRVEGKGFTTQTIDFVATGATTTISFIEAANSSGGNNDPMIDRVIFEASTTAVPEPASLALLAGGLSGMFLLRRRKKSVADGSASRATGA